jgi:hypothetical protein
MSKQKDNSASEAGWMPLATALDRAIQVGMDKFKAKIAICNAIADLSMWVSVTAAPGGDIFERHAVDLPDNINPGDFDWANSRPLWPWQTRATENTNWQARTITHIAVSSEDFTHQILRDPHSVRIPDRSFTEDLTAAVSAEQWRGFSREKWVPSEATRKALLSFESKPYMSFGDAVSIVAFGSLTEPIRRNEFELTARKLQAARAICDAVCNADTDDLLLKGKRGTGFSTEWIPFDYFRTPRCIGDVANSLGPDWERLDSTAKKEGPTAPDRFVEWSDVEIETEPFLGWLRSEISTKQREELRRQHSLRLYEHRLWSLADTVRWIAFRDHKRMNEPRSPNDLGIILGGIDPRNEASPTAAQPEIELLRALQEGNLLAQQAGATVPQAHWINVPANLEWVKQTSRWARFNRDDVIAAFQTNTYDRNVSIERQEEGLPVSPIPSTIDLDPVLVRRGPVPKDAFYLAKYDERLKDNRTEKLLKKEADELYKIGEKHFGTVACLSFGTIQNIIRENHKIFRKIN